MPLLSILIATIDDGILSATAMLLPPNEQWQYIISWQKSKDYVCSSEVCSQVAILEQRSDVIVDEPMGIGLSANRNNTLRLWNTAYALISDDDMRYTEAQLSDLLAAFHNQQEVDIFCFRVKKNNEEELKAYPTVSFFYPQRPKGYYVSSVEIALRRKDSTPKFDERFGLGAPLLCAGEEEVFIHECWQQGWHICYLPQIIGTTKAGETTAERKELQQRLRYTKGAVLYKIYGFVGGLLRCVKQAVTPFSLSSLSLLKDLLRGFFYGFFHQV